MKIRDGAGVVHASGNGVPTYLLSACGRLAFDSSDVGKVDDDTPTTCFDCLVGAMTSPPFAVISAALKPITKAKLHIRYADGAQWSGDAPLVDRGDGTYSLQLPPVTDAGIVRVMLTAESDGGVFAQEWAL